MIQEGKWGKITCPQCSNEAAILNEPTKVFQYTRRAVRFEVMVRDQANSHFKHEAMRLGRCDDRSYNFDASRTDRDIVLAAVQKQGIALKYASEALKADREIVLAAVKNNGYALQYASEDHKADREIVQAAIKIDPCALLCASEGLSADREIVLSAVQRGGDPLWSTRLRRSGPTARSCLPPSNIRGMLWSMRLRLSGPTARSCSRPSSRTGVLSNMPQRL